MTDQPKTNVEAAQAHVNNAIQNLTTIYGEGIPTNITQATSSVATAQALISISCQLDRIANALEAQARGPIRVHIEGRDFAGAVQRAASDRKGR